MSRVQAPMVSVVVVTYGSRATFLRQVVAGLAAQSRPPGQVIVVDNGASPAPLAVLEPVSHPGRLEVIPLGANRGSAVGFGVGMRRALELGSDLVWLLDDDNLPHPTALEHLVRRWEQAGEPDSTAFAAMRRDRRKYVDAARGLPSMRFSAANSFMGSSALGRVGSWFRGRGSRPVATAGGPLVLDVAIYGGLLIPSALLRRTGLPDAAFFVYLDDRDFTTRITRAGGSIVLVPDAIVEDLDDSWGGDTERRAPILFNRSIRDDQLYYTVRNAVHYERRYVVSARPIYLLNMVAHVVRDAIVTLGHGAGPRFVLRRTGLLRRAIADGWHGRLGERTPDSRGRA